MRRYTQDYDSPALAQSHELSFVCLDITHFLMARFIIMEMVPPGTNNTGGYRFPLASVGDYTNHDANTEEARLDAASKAATRAAGAADGAETTAAEPAAKCATEGATVDVPNSAH